MANKRHAKPTAMQIAERSYRKILALSALISEECRDTRLRLHQLELLMGRRLNNQAVLIDHCARLLREKETLQKRLYAVKELKDEARTDAISEAVKYTIVDDSEVTIHSHSPGSQCTEYCRTFPSRPQL